VLTSPLQRAARTCEWLALGRVAPKLKGDLIEWNYGEYEGRRRTDIQAERPAWQLFRGGCPGGETPQQVGARLIRDWAARLLHATHCFSRAGTF